jgi:hypothetical protein
MASMVNFVQNFIRDNTIPIQNLSQNIGRTCANLMRKHYPDTKTRKCISNKENYTPLD